MNEHSVLPDNDKRKGHDQYIKPNLITMLGSALDCSANRSCGLRGIVEIIGAQEILIDSFTFQGNFFQKFPIYSRENIIRSH